MTCHHDSDEQDLQDRETQPWSTTSSRRQERRDNQGPRPSRRLGDDYPVGLGERGTMVVQSARRVPPLPPGPRCPKANSARPARPCHAH